jgi:hypothetical protein
MSHATLQTEIETRFLDAWKSETHNHTVLDNGLCVGWNALSSAWEPVDPAVQDLSPYVSLQIQELKSNTVTIGAPTKRRRTIGNVHLEVSVPRQVGTITARTMADDIKTIFRDVMTVSGIEFFEGSVSRIGEKYYANNGSALPETSQKWILVVSIPFRYDVDI